MGIEFYLKGAVIKHEAVVDLDKVLEFKAKHDKHMDRKNADPAGQDYCFTYRPSGIGTAVEVTCRCGVKIDLTDYRSW